MANKKITELDTASGLADTDLVPVVTDPAGTPATEKATVADVRGSAIIGEVVVTGASQATVTFDAIPATFRDLRLVAQVRSTNNALNDTVLLTVNDQTGYRTTRLRASNTVSSTQSTATLTATVAQIAGLTAPGSVADSLIVDFPNYAGAVFYKNIFSQSTYRYGNTAAQYLQDHSTIHLDDTSPISKIVLTPNAGEFEIGSSFVLWGIGSDPFP